MIKVTGLLLLLVGAAGCAFAGRIVPEIDASSGTAALALISGGLVVLWGRRRSK
jgi:hypothetical protein